MNQSLIFHQLYETQSSTYTYLLADKESREAVLIDTVLEAVDRDLRLVRELKLSLKYVLDSHIHADHVTGAGTIRMHSGAKSGVSAVANVPCADLSLRDGDILTFGPFEIKAIATPGHTDACMTFLCEGMAFTGDALLIRGTGRTDFQSGSAEKLYDSITQRLFQLPESTVIYPAHDYAGFTHTTIPEERDWNPRVGKGKSKQEFVKIMSELKLSYPKKIDVALPANRSCGIVAEEQAPKLGEREISPADALEKKDRALMLDVRPLTEYQGELGHIPGAHRAELGPDLNAFLQGYNRAEEIIFVCGSGVRSAAATKAALDLGFKRPMSLTGGMRAWNQLNLPTERK